METEVNELEIGTESDVNDVRTNVYEVGYHLLPTLSEEEVTSAVSGIMEAIKKEGGEFVGDRFPSSIDLAYTISKRVSGKLTNFDRAYFGWVAFEAPRKGIAKLKVMLDDHPSVLRSLIVITDKDAVASALSAVETPIGPTGSIDKPKREADGEGEVSEVALDEALEEIETEDAKVAE